MIIKVGVAFVIIGMFTYILVLICTSEVRYLCCLMCAGLTKNNKFLEYGEEPALDKIFRERGEKQQEAKAAAAAAAGGGGEI